MHFLLTGVNSDKTVVLVISKPASSEFVGIVDDLDSMYNPVVKYELHNSVSRLVVHRRLYFYHFVSCFLVYFYLPLTREGKL